MSVEGKPEDVMTWLWTKCHKYPTAIEAFESLQDLTKRNAFHNTKRMYGLGDTEDAYTAQQFFETYMEGKRHFQTAVHMKQFKPELCSMHEARYPFELMNDPHLRMYEAGRLHYREDHLSREELLESLNKLLKEETPSAEEFTMEDVNNVFAQLMCGAYLINDGRLHFQDFWRFYEKSSDPQFACMESAALAVAKDDERTHAPTKAKTDKQAAKSLEAKMKIAYEGANRLMLERTQQTLVQRVVEEVKEVVRAAAAVDVGGEAEVQLHRDPKGQVKLNVVLPAKPSLVLAFAGLDEERRGLLSLASVRLALLQFGIPTTSTDVHVLGSLCKHEKEWGRVDWVRLLVLLGVADEEAASSPAASRQYIDDAHASLRQWEKEAKAVLQQNASAGATVKSDEVGTLLVFQTQPDPSEIAATVHSTGVSGMQHPFFGAAAVAKVVAACEGRLKELYRMLRSMDTNLEGLADESQLKYALKCVGIKLSPQRLAVIMDTFRAPPRPNRLHHAQKPLIHFETLLRAICPSGAQLCDDKETLGLNARDERFAGDVVSAMAVMARDVYEVFLKLRRLVYDQDTYPWDGAITTKQLQEALQEGGVKDFNEQDAAWALKFFHSPYDNKVQYPLFIQMVSCAMDRVLPIWQVPEEELQYTLGSI